MVTPGPMWPPYYYTMNKPGKNFPWRELAWLTAFYLVFAIFYMVVLRLSYRTTDDGFLEILSDLNWRIIYLDYTFKGLFTIPVYLLTFRWLKGWSVGSRILVNLVLLPFWVKGWQLTYYWLVDTLFDGGHLAGAGQWWDVYIPALFYVLQFGIFHAYAYHQDLRATERARAESDRLALSSELSALKAQLNPHFLYNAFNTISASTGPGQEQTRQMIAQLSDLFRYQLRANREDLVPLHSELDFIRAYLDLEKERFGTRLHYEIELDNSDTEGALLPPLLLQPLVENAVRHGIAPLIDGGKVVVKVHTEADRLHLSVEDNGTGFEPSTLTRGYGQTNTERRLTLLFQESLHLRSAPGKGTCCSFSIPLNYAPKVAPDRRRSAVAQTLA